MLLCRGGRGPSAWRKERTDVGEEKGRKIPGDGKKRKKRLQKMNVLVILLSIQSILMDRYRGRESCIFHGTYQKGSISAYRIKI